MVAQVTRSRQLPVGYAVSRGVSWVFSAPGAHCRCLHLHPQAPGRTTTLPTDTHDAGHDEEHRVQLVRRRAAVAQQLRRLALELADLDRQLDEIEQSQR